MKRYGLGCMLICCMLVLPSYLVGQTTLLKEDFEKGASAPEGWKKGVFDFSGYRGGKVDGVKYVYDKKISKSGKRSLGFQKTAQRYFPVATWSRKLKRNSDMEAIKVSAQVKAEKATKAIVEVSFLDKRKNQITKEWIAYIGAKGESDPPADHDWKEYSGKADIPEGTDRIQFSLQIYGPGKVWFDDVVATYVEAEAVEEAPPLENQVEVKVGDSVGHYLHVPARKPDSTNGSGLLIVLPGGSGSADFHPFVNRIHENALGDDFVLAQPLAKMWTKGQQVVWPTEGLKVSKMEFSTEQLIDSVVADVGAKTKLDPKRIYVLAWSSGGPAAYAAMLKKDSPITGGFLAMSVFYQNMLPALENGKEKSFYIFHSKDDKVCPHWMAKKAHAALSEAGARTKFEEYQGGHGWVGNVYGNIAAGMKWLDPKDD